MLVPPPFTTVLSDAFLVEVRSMLSPMAQVHEVRAQPLGMVGP